jgi:hypothetical protein
VIDFAAPCPAGKNHSRMPIGAAIILSFLRPIAAVPTYILAV